MYYTQKFAYFLDLSSIQDSLAFNLKLLTDNRHNSRKGRVLICNINMPLPQNLHHGFSRKSMLIAYTIMGF